MKALLRRLHDVVRGVVGRSSADAGSIGKLIDQAWAERTRGADAPPPSQAEIAEVQQLLDNPAVSDHFSPELKSNLESFVRGNVNVPQRSVADLVPDMDRLSRANEVAARFAADYALFFGQRLFVCWDCKYARLEFRVARLEHR